MTLIQSSLIVLLVAVFGISGFKWQGLYVKYTSRFNGFFKMPVSVGEINLQCPQQFVLSGKDKELNVDLYCHPNDPRVCLLFDTYGFIAGIQTGYIQADIESKAKKNNLTFPYDYRAISMFKEGTLFGKKLFYTSALFVNPDIIKAGGRKFPMGQVMEGVFVKMDGKWLEVARNECDVENQGFTKQSCVNGMGQHYFYQMNSRLDCKDLQPFFPLYENKQLIGFGLIPFGSFTSEEGGTEWFEYLTEQVAKVIVPYAPQCAYDWIDTIGSTSLHVYFKHFPRFITCPCATCVDPVRCLQNEKP